MKTTMLFVIVAFVFVDFSESANSTSRDRPGSWTKCIGNEIGKCLSCVLEDSAELVEAVIAAAAGDEEETVEGILKTMGKALQCAVECSQASTTLVAKQCGSFYCKTDFCVKCCGKGSWQCMGNDFTPQCAPTKQFSFVEKMTQMSKDGKQLIQTVVNKAAEEVEEMEQTVVETLEAAVAGADAKDVASMIQKCQCGAGSGDPDSCCSKCQASSDKHNVPHCAGGGKNTGPFCGNDFHITEPNACYGETPLCCTNDMGIPKCCKLGQVCHSPLLGDNECRDAEETLVV